MDENSVPDVMSYLDVCQYLNDYYAFRKKADGRFSYQAWADELTLVSKSYLRFVVFGKRKISEDLQEKLCRTMNLTGDAREYLVLLILYSQSSEPTQKQVLGRKMLSLVKASAKPQVVEPFHDLLSHPRNLAIRNILSFSDVDCTREFLVETFAISMEEVSDLLLKLQEAGLVYQTDRQTWKATDSYVRVNTTNRDSILNYHRLSLLQAIEAQKKEAHERHYLSLNLALDSEAYAQYLEKLEGFKREIVALFEDSSIKNKKLYQMNFNIIPMTGTIG